MAIVNLVYDAPAPFEYWFDFRNKTMTDVATEWWGNNTWSLSCGSTGLSWSTGRTFKQLLTATQMAKANKITFKAQVYISSYSTYDHTRWFSTSNTETKPTMVYSYSRNLTIIAAGSESWYSRYSVSSWTTLTWTCVFDLRTKTASFQFNSWSTLTKTMTLTDQNVSDIRSNNAYWNILVNSWVYLQTIYCKVE